MSFTRSRHCPSQISSSKIQATLKPILKTAVAGAFLVLLCGCASTPTAEPFYTRIFAGNYDQVWLSTLKALNDYPLKLSNKDTGRIETEVVNGPYNELLFTNPELIELPERFRFSLKISFAKLQTTDDEPLTRVRIVKNLERFRDFYAGWAGANSDGLEEKILLYRVEHLLGIEKKIAELTSAGPTSAK